MDIKTFSIQGLPLSVTPTAVFTETVNERQARVLTLNELKEKMEAEGGQFKQYHSITDYHGMMFDLGIIPKRLRSSSDRSKFYKLIEASFTEGFPVRSPVLCVIIYCPKIWACVKPSKIWKVRCVKTE